MTITFVAIGLAAGVLAGLFGIGGGILIVPSLILFAKLPSHIATGTSLMVLALPVVALGAWEHWRNGRVDVSAALMVGAGLFVGAWIGARIGGMLPEVMLRRLFAAFLVVVAVRLWLKG